jgi:glycosidase
VFNHASRGFFAFHHLLENGASSPYRDWFHVRRFPLHAYDNSPRRPLNYASWWGLPELPKFNTRTPAARNFLLGVAEHWVREGIDGWRLDVPTEIADPGFWRALRRLVKAANPEVYLVGEIWDTAPDWLRGDRFDALMNYPLSRLTLGFFGGRDLDTSARPGGYRLRALGAPEFARQLKAMFGRYPRPVNLAQLNLLGSHDTPRALSLLGGNLDRLRLALLFLLTSPGAPCIYYGDEIGLRGGADPACRAAMPWKRSRWNLELREYVRRLIKIRHGHEALRRGTFTIAYARAGVFAFVRRTKAETLLVALNTNQHSVEVRVPVPPGVRDGTSLRPILAEYPAGVASGRTSPLALAALSGGVWQVR